MFYKRKAFPVGIHPHETMNGKKVTGVIPIRAVKAPDLVTILLGQHVGPPCAPLVKPGESVYLGQKIGEPQGFMGAPVHASVSGTVKGIEWRTNAAGQQVQGIVIENDHQDTWDPSIRPVHAYDKMNIEDMIRHIRECGIVGMGGAAFPTSIKLSPPEGKPIDVLILNGAECEPYLTCDHRMMLENSDLIMEGMRIASRILGVKRAYIGIEDNKPDAIERMKQFAYGENCEVFPMPARYPQGGEKQNIYTITGRQVPSGGLPLDVGVVVLNVSTAVAIATAFQLGRPLIERVVTVTGAVRTPGNYRVRVGMSLGELVDVCGGGTLPGANKAIHGGPMMGMAVYDPLTPVVKATSGLLMMIDEIGQEPASNCIRCATCIGACPIGLMPLTIRRYSDLGSFKTAKSYHAMDCIECGSCSYVCPAKIPLSQAIRVAKREIVRRKI